MKKYRIIIAATILLLLVNTILLCFLWFGKKHLPPPPQNAGPAMVVENLLKDELLLNADQLKQFRTLREEHFRFNQQLNDSLHLQKDALFSLLGKKDSSSNAVDSITNMIAHFEKKKDLNTFAHFSKVRLLLTATQQEKFDGIINDILRMVAGPQPGNHSQPPPPGEGYPHGKRPPPEGPDMPPPPGDGPPPGQEHRPE